jgi:hypothetical protein
MGTKQCLRSCAGSESPIDSPIRTVDRPCAQWMALSTVSNPSANRVQVVLDIEYSGMGYHQSTVRYMFAGLSGRNTRLQYLD